VKKRQCTQKLKRSFVVGVATSLALLVGACATFNKPATIDVTPIKSRAQTKAANGIRVSTALVSDAEARRIFGIDLAKKRIQALWLAVENDTDQPLVLLPTAIDPEYFAPLEVAFAFHKSFAATANRALDDHLLTLNFPVRSLILPRSEASGYIFTGRSEEVKALDVDLLGDNFIQNFTFFAPNPNNDRATKILGKIDALYSGVEARNVENEADLRQVLEQLPCCVSQEKGGPSAEPLNVIIIGDLDDWTTAFIRRGYHYFPLNPRYVFGRSQDISGTKLGGRYIKTQAQTIRIWKTTIRYQGQPVWVGQASSRLGGRFAKTAITETTLPLAPQVDEARNDFTQDLAYSQALIRIGHVKGAGRHPPVAAEAPGGQMDYRTDGLRVVLVFGGRPAALETIDFFDWERLSDYSQSN
jgi:hypothetical protein